LAIQISIAPHLKGRNCQLHAFYDVVLQTVPIIPKGPSIYAYYSSMITPCTYTHSKG